MPADGFGSTALVSQTKMLGDAGQNIFSWQFVDYYGMNKDQLVLWNTFLDGKSSVADLTKGLQGDHRQGGERQLGDEDRDQVTATVTQPLPGGDTVPTRRRRAGRWTFDKISFMVVFLGLPLAIYLVLVVSPFAQAVYYSMTDWTGFSPQPELRRAGQLPADLHRRHLPEVACATTSCWPSCCRWSRSR